MKHYEILLKRAKVEAMKIELEKLSPEKIFLSGIPDKRGRDGQVDRARRRDMLKITVPEFKRGDADEVLNSATNFNTVCSGRAASRPWPIWTRPDQKRTRSTWATSSNDWWPKTPRSSRRCELSLASDRFGAA